MVLQDFSSRGTAEETLKMEMKFPHAFSGDTLSFCKSVLGRTDGVTLDAINKEIGTHKSEMVAAYEKTYRDLLQLKGQTFEAVNMEIQKNANDILRFGRKKTMPAFKRTRKRRRKSFITQQRVVERKALHMQCLFYFSAREAS